MQALTAAGALAGCLLLAQNHPSPPVTGLKVLSTTIDPNAYNVGGQAVRDVIVKVQNATDKTVVAYLVIYLGFDQQGKPLGDGLGAGIANDYNGPEPGSDHFILPGQIGTIRGYAVGPETASVEARIDGVVYQNDTAEGTKAHVFFESRARRASEIREASGREVSLDKKAESEQQAQWFEIHSKEVRQ